MYQLTNQFIDTAKALKEAMLLTTVANGRLLIRTGNPGSLPMITCMPYAVIVNHFLALEAVDPNSPRAEEVVHRTLAHEVNGQEVHLFTSRDRLDLVEQRVKQHGLSSEAKEARLPVVVLELPGYPTYKWFNDAMTLAIDISALPPSAVREMLDFVMDSPEFRGSQHAFYSSARGKAIYHASDALKNRINRAVRATRPDTVESVELRQSGNTDTFGTGLAPRVVIDSLTVAAAYAALDNRDSVTEADFVAVFPRVAAHRIQWLAAKPYPAAAALTRVAQWAVSV